MLVSDGLWAALEQLVDPTQPRDPNLFMQRLQAMTQQFPVQEVVNVSSWVLRGIIMDHTNGTGVPGDMAIEDGVNQVMAGMQSWIGGIGRGNIQRAMRIAAGHVQEAHSWAQLPLIQASMLAVTILLAGYDDWRAPLQRTKVGVETDESAESAATFGGPPASTH